MAAGSAHIDAPADMSGGPVLVKLGGSLARHPALAAWLTAVRDAPGPPGRLVVPGGGPFADAVRALEAPLGLDAATAHRCAILAMQQYGLLLAARAPGLRPVETEAELAALGRDGGAGVWLPWRLAGTAPELEPSWAVTSDSIAVWLAARLRARALVIVKATPPPAAEPDVLAAAGVLDAAFPRYRRQFAGPVRVVGATPPPDPARLSALLAP